MHKLLVVNMIDQRTNDSKQPIVTLDIRQSKLDSNFNHVYKGLPCDGNLPHKSA